MRMTQIPPPNVPGLPLDFSEKDNPQMVAQWQCFAYDYCRWSELRKYITHPLFIVSDSQSTYDHKRRMHRIEKINYNPDGSVKDRKVSWHK